MPAVVIASPEPLAGKTTFSAGLAQRLHSGRQRLGVVRLAGDERAESDAALFHGLSFNAQRFDTPIDPATLRDIAGETSLLLVEAPAGEPAGILDAASGSRVIVVAAGSATGEVVDYAKALGASLAGVALNRVPAKREAKTRAELETAGIRVLASVPEDRVLAAPTLSQIAEAIQARSRYLNGYGDTVVERPIIASIAADPGQSYFMRLNPTAVIVRGDRPDLHLAALHAGAPCLILTGGFTPLQYVIERSEDDRIPLLQTEMDTVSTALAIEDLYGKAPFAAAQEKVDRLADLLASFDLSALD